MRITIFGSGYVGLVTGACLADAGNQVVCVDVDRRKVEMLSAGEIPIHEPGLDVIVRRTRYLLAKAQERAHILSGLLKAIDAIDEVIALADRVTVLRDGRRVLTAPIGELSRGAIISAMVGRDVALSHRDAVAAAGAPVLSVRDLTLSTVSRRGWRRVLHGVSFDLRRGEILGIGGLLGSGRTEILESIFGVARGWRGGEIRVDGDLVVNATPAESCRLGVALVTEDRKARGLHLASSICDNVALPSVGELSRFGVRAFAREAALADDVVERLSVRCNGIEQIAATLSGGNQQKVVIGKWLATEPRILLLDEPTRGIDVGAKQEIYQLVFKLAAEGLGIVVVSSEMLELLLLSDRVLVMCEGRQTGVLARAEATQEAIMRLAAPGVAAEAEADPR